jgi:hypothetical protein
VEGSDDLASENECRDALHLLFQLLRLAFGEGAQTVRDFRAQYIIALHNLAMFLKMVSAGKDKDIAQRFIQLALALFDIQRGAQPELLRINANLHGRPVDPTDVWMVRSHAAAALECLVRSGMSELDAAKLIIKNSPEIAKAVRPGRNDVASLLYWRKALNDKLPKHDIAIDSFHAALEVLDLLAAGPTAPDLRAIGMHMTTQLPRSAAGLIRKS